MSAYIIKDVQICPDIMTVYELYDSFREGRIHVMPQWLQRLRQTSKWQKSKCAKAKSFLRYFFGGNSLLTPFYLVKIEVLISHIQSELDAETDKTKLKILKEMYEELQECVSRGVQLILLDGQNRLTEAIVPFFMGTLADNNYSRPFRFLVDGQKVELNSFKYTDIDLDEGIKTSLRETQVLVAEGTEGNISDFVQSIVDMNHGEPWSEFEATIITPTQLSFLINKDTFKDAIIQSLFGSYEMSGNVKDMTGNYHPEKKGDARFIAEMVYMIDHNCNSGQGTEAALCSMISESDQTSIKAYAKVKKYLNLISTTFDCPQNTDVKQAERPFTRTLLSSIILFLDLMYNSNNIRSGDCPVKLRSLDKEGFPRPKSIITDFINWHNEKIDKHTTPEDFVNGEPLPETYVIHTRGATRENIIGRMSFINDYISKNYETWVQRGDILSSTTDYKTLQTLLKKNSGHKDIYNKANPKIDLRSKVSIDHVVAKRGDKFGDDSIENLVITNPKSNSIKSNRY